MSLGHSPNFAISYISVAYFKYKRHALLTTESDQSGIIRDWLVENGLMPDEQFETGDGPVDLYLGGRRVLIETKKRERLKKRPSLLYLT